MVPVATNCPPFMFNLDGKFIPPNVNTCKPGPGAQARPTLDWAPEPEVPLIDVDDVFVVAMIESSIFAPLPIWILQLVVITCCATHPRPECGRSDRSPILNHLIHSKHCEKFPLWCSAAAANCCHRVQISCAINRFRRSE